MNKFLVADSDCKQKQDSNTLSFIGGFPSLPKDTILPVCTLCGAQQTFFFQTAFTEEHCWKGYSLAAFLCTSCADENHLIPEMLKGELKGADIPKGFLEKYQTNFRFVVAKTEDCIIREDYNPKIKYMPLKIKKSLFSSSLGIRLGLKPDWVLEDESPASYDSSTKMVFLCQVPQDYEFPIINGAPPQIELDLGGVPTESSREYYEYFIGNAVYLFGTEDLQEPLIYAITQV